MNPLDFLTMQDLEKMAAIAGDGVIKAILDREITDREQEICEMHYETQARLTING